MSHLQKLRYGVFSVKYKFQILAKLNIPSILNLL